ncbi:MAG: xanthine dehydrogenase family protein subunit M [Acidimicrobiia bacterium]
MKPAPFDYECPTTIDEAVAVLARGDAKVLAGGQSLIPVLALRLATFDQLVDLRKIDELQQIDVGPESVRVGAMIRQAAAERHDGLRSAVPLLARALANVGHFQIRNRGTVGGSIAHADPAAELPAVALALDATLEAAGPNGRRDIAAADFFEGTFTTALAEHEILTAIRFPVWGPGSGFAVEEVARRHGDFALVGAVCGVQISGGIVSRAAIALFGMGSTPVRASAAEQELVGAAPSSIDLAALGTTAMIGLDPPTDIHASGEYRKAVGAHVVRTAITRALEEAHRG